jgi:hypothetical protein
MSPFFTSVMRLTLNENDPFHQDRNFEIVSSAQQSRQGSTATKPPLIPTALGAAQGASAARAQVSGVDRDCWVTGRLTPQGFTADLPAMAALDPSKRYGSGDR